MRFVEEFIGHNPDPQFNSMGHRCKELKELNFHNYVLFIGDNPGLGLDKPIEETYPYIVTKHMNVDYYNLCVFNGGVDALRYNTLLWLHRFEQKPKAIFSCCEFLNSILVSDRNKSFIRSCDPNDLVVQDVLENAQTSGYFDFRNYLADKMISRMIGFPIYQISFKNRKQIFSKNVINIDYDDDIYNYKKIAEVTIDFLTKRSSKVRP